MQEELKGSLINGEEIVSTLSRQLTTDFRGSLHDASD